MLTKLNWNSLNRISIRCIVKRWIQSSSDMKTCKEPMSPLTEHLVRTIQIGGPMSMGTYMRSCLTHPLGGYYTSSENVFGPKGDFITSPEISQVFGELLAIWFTTQIQSNLEKVQEGVQIIELGPGRGTLIADMMRTWRQLQIMTNKIQSIHLIEASKKLQEIQADALGVTLENANEKSGGRKGFTKDGIEVTWHFHLEDVPRNRFSMILAHEFFDALPIYTFERTKEGWREVMVDIDESLDRAEHFRLVLAPSATKASIAMTNDARYDSKPVGSRIEISPEASGYARKIAQRISEDGGCALYVDYGQDSIPSDTLRAIRKHKFTSILSYPGESDVTADVDFSLIRNTSQDLVQVHGPMSQRDFLHTMGITARMKMLFEKSSAEQRKELAHAYDRLVGVGPDQMGSVYKVMGLTAKGAKQPYPFVTEQLGQ